MRIYTATPKPFLTKEESDDSFFSRDMGLTCYALREQGVESMVVMLNSPEAKDHPDIIRTSIKDMENAEWWGRHNLDAVVLGAWAAPRYTPIAKAIKESGAKVIIRCDSGGPYSQWQKGLRGALYSNYLSPRYQGRGAFLSCLYSLLKTSLFYVPSMYEKKVVRHMSYGDFIMNETPEGVRYLKAFLCGYSRTDIAARVKYVPHPVADGMGYSNGIKKEKRIVSVGRWDSYQKNAQLLVPALGAALAERPDYEAHVFGGGVEILHSLCVALPDNLKARIHIRGKVPNRNLVAEYQRSQIFFAPSRSESFNIAAAEALSCGCSFAGSEHIFSFRNFVSRNTGTLARNYTVAGMRDALMTEIMDWDFGLRDPNEISSIWGAEVAGNKIIRQIISCVEEGADAP